MKKVFGQLLRYRTLLWYIGLAFLFKGMRPILFYNICLCLSHTSYAQTPYIKFCGAFSKATASRVPQSAKLSFGVSLLAFFAPTVSKESG